MQVTPTTKEAIKLYAKLPSRSQQLFALIELQKLIKENSADYAYVSRFITTLRRLV